MRSDRRRPVKMRSKLIRPWRNGQSQVCLNLARQATGHDRQYGLHYFHGLSWTDRTLAPREFHPSEAPPTASREFSQPARVN